MSSFSNSFNSSSVAICLILTRNIGVSINIIALPINTLPWGTLYTEMEY